MTMRDKFTDLLRQTTIGRKMLAETAEEALKKRRAHVEAVKQIRQQELEELPAVQKKLSAAQRAFHAAHHKWSMMCSTRPLMLRQQAIVLQKEADLLEAKAAVGQVTYPADHQAGQHENALHESASEAIDEFVTEMRELWDETRSHPAAVQEQSRYDLAADKKQVESIFTNAPSKRTRMAAIQAARDKALALKTEAVEDIEAELQKLRDFLP